MPAERLASPLRYVLALVLCCFSLWATGHFAWLYGHRHLWLGLLCTLVLGALLIVGVLSFALARRRLGAELRYIGLPVPPAGSLIGDRRQALLRLRERGGRPDLGALAQEAGARVGQAAYLGRYFVAVAVLIGLLGTFAGLMETLAGVSTLLKEDPGKSLNSVLLLLSAPLSGLEVTFGASMAGILVTVTLALLQGDLTLVEEHLLGALEARTAHELLPELWPAAEEPAQRAQREIAALRADLGGLITRLCTWQDTAERNLALLAEKGAALLSAQTAEGQRLLREHAAHTAETLARGEAQLMDLLDTRVRQTHDALSAQVRRLLGGVEGAVQALTEDHDHRQQEQGEALRQLLSGLGEHFSQTATGVAAAAQRAAEQAAEGALAAAQQMADGAAQALQQAAEQASQAAQQSAEQAAHAAQQAAGQSAQAAQRAAEQSMQAAQRAMEQPAQAAQAAGEQLARYAAALCAAEHDRTRALEEGERRRAADHEALRQRLSEFIEEGVAAPLAVHLRTWEQAAHTVGEAGGRLEQSAAILGQGAERFAAGAADLTPHLAVLAPELHALSGEMALLLSRGADESALPPQLLAELMRLTDGIERLELRLQGSAPPAPAEHAPPLSETG